MIYLRKKYGPEYKSDRNVNDEIANKAQEMKNKIQTDIDSGKIQVSIDREHEEPILKMAFPSDKCEQQMKLFINRQLMMLYINNF